MRLLLAVVLTGLLLAGCDGKGPAFQATDITGAELGRALQLSDHNGTPRTFADFRGKVLVVFFGRFRESVKKAEWQSGVERHQQIIDALRDGKVAAAASLLTSHIESHRVRLNVAK